MKKISIRKNIVVAVMAALIVTSFAGCGESSDEKKDHSSTAPSSSMSESQNSAEDSVQKSSIIEATANEQSESESKTDSSEEEKPAALSSFAVIDSAGYGYSEEILTDSFGFKYKGYHSINCGNYKTGYAIFNLNKEYSTVDLSIIAFTDTRSNTRFKIAFLLDDELVKTVDEFTKTSGKNDVNLDVNGKTKLEIRITSDDNLWDSNGMSIGVVDAKANRQV